MVSLLPFKHWCRTKNGSLAGNSGQVGVGGIPRDANGQWIKGFAINIATSMST